MKLHLPTRLILTALAALGLISCSSPQPDPAVQQEVSAAQQRLLKSMFALALCLFLAGCNFQHVETYSGGMITATSTTGSFLESTTSDADKVTLGNGVSISHMTTGKDQTALGKAALTAWGTAKTIEGLTARTVSNNQASVATNAANQSAATTQKIAAQQAASNAALLKSNTPITGAALAPVTGH